MRINEPDVKRPAVPVTPANTGLSILTLILGVTALLLIAFWFFSGDQFTSTPTMGGTNGTAPASTPIPAK